MAKATKKSHKMFSLAWAAHKAIIERLAGWVKNGWVQCLLGKGVHTRFDTFFGDGVVFQSFKIHSTVLVYWLYFYFGLFVWSQNSVPGAIRLTVNTCFFFNTVIILFTSQLCIRSTHLSTVPFRYTPISFW